jgi:hypothetical protein
VHDSIELERRGIPAIAICTEPFVPGAKAMCNLAGLPEQRFATISHPIGSLTASQIRERALEAAPQVIEALLQAST